MTTIIAITGGRHHHPSRAELYDFGSLVSLLAPAIVVHGACPTGVDAVVSEHVAKTTDATLEAWPAAWKSMGKSAGPIRNRAMLLGADARDGMPGRGRADFLIAWPGGTGTLSCVTEAARLGVLVVNAKAIRSHLLRGNEWTLEQVLDRLAGMRRRAAEAVKS